MREVLGVVFIAVAIAWSWRVHRVHRRDRERAAPGAAFDFASGYAIELILIVGLICLGLLLVTGHWWNP